MKKAHYIILLVTIFYSGILSGCATQNKSIVNLGNGIIQESSSPLMWQQNRSPMLHTWAEAKKYATDLNLGGFSDWRLPTRKELLNLYFVFDFGAAKQGAQTIILDGNYWSQENDGAGFTGAWKDGDSCEISRTYQKTSKGGYVRAVRP